MTGSNWSKPQSDLKSVVDPVEYAESCSCQLRATACPNPNERVQNYSNPKSSPTNPTKDHPMSQVRCTSIGRGLRESEIVANVVDAKEPRQNQLPNSERNPGGGFRRSIRRDVCAVRFCTPPNPRRSRFDPSPTCPRQATHGLPIPFPSVGSINRSKAAWRPNGWVFASGLQPLLWGRRR